MQDPHSAKHPKALPGRRNSRPEMRIGTSGWHYADWWGPFYPETLKKKDALSHYVTRFNATELNAPFYRTPTEDAVRNWAGSTPDDFRFAWKASRFITHWRRLNVDQNSMDLLESRLALLGDKLGPVLFQLPPQMKIDRERLAGFIKALHPKRRCAFEFRHPSWYDASILALLADHGMSLCLSDHASAPAPREATADWVYIRNHGPTGRYHGNYSEDALADWADDIARWREEGRDIWCFFDNDVKSAAPADAAKLLELAGSD